MKYIHGRAVVKLKHKHILHYGLTI